PDNSRESGRRGNNVCRDAANRALGCEKAASACTKGRGSRVTKALRFAIPLLALAACAQLQVANPQSRSDWNRTLYYARQNVDARNYFAADTILDEFVRTHPNTREAREIAFWKAAYMLDPANELGSLPGGIA